MVIKNFLKHKQFGLIKFSVRQGCKQFTNITNTNMNASSECSENKDAGVCGAATLMELPF